MTTYEKFALLYPKENQKIIMVAKYNHYNFDMECKEDGDFLDYAIQYSKDIFLNKTEVNYMPEKYEDYNKLFNDTINYYKRIYENKITPEVLSLIQKTEIKRSNVYEGFNNLFIRGMDINTKGIKIAGPSDKYLCSILIHELAHSLYPLPKNIYHGESLPMLHEWLFMDQTYIKSRSLEIFAAYFETEKEYLDIEDRELRNVIIDVNKINYKMYLISYIYSLVLKKYYLEDPILFMKQLLLNRKNNLCFQKLLEYYNINFDSEGTKTVFEQSCKILIK